MVENTVALFDFLLGCIVMWMCFLYPKLRNKIPSSKQMGELGWAKTVYTFSDAAPLTDEAKQAISEIREYTLKDKFDRRWRCTITPLGHFRIHTNYIDDPAKEATFFRGYIKNIYQVKLLMDQVGINDK